MQMMPSATKRSLSAGGIAKAVVLRGVRICAYFAIALTAGFSIFAYSVTNMPLAPLGQADGIVVLTGDEDRIAEAVKLLSQGKGGRLLISGVNKTTRTPELIQLTARWKDAFLFRCCVDLDKRSLNTEGNAVETTAWARRLGFRSLIVVTSTYHMPRALIELHQSMPDVQLMPYPVKATRLEPEWWHNPRTAWVLCKEYLKFVTASARYAAKRLTNDQGTAQLRKRTINARLD